MTQYDKMTKAELIEELRKKEKLFSSAYELASSSNDAIIGKSLDGIISSWNRGAENIYGYSAKEIIGQNITILSPSDRHDEVLRILEKIKRGERVEHFETVRVTKEGRQIHVSLSISPVIDATGGIKGASTIARDVTEHKRMEEELLLTKLCVDKASISICRVAPDGKILDVNDCMCRSLGYSRNELTSMSIFDIDPNFTREIWTEHRKKTWATGTRTFETLHRRKDGTVFPVEVTVIYLTFGGKEVSISFARDITERKRMEEELLLTKFCIDKASITICLTAPDGKILDVNDYMCKSLGYTREELASMSIFDVDPTLTLETWPEHRKKVQVTGTRTFETLHRRKDATTFPVEVTVNYLTFGGKEVGISFARDITERKRAEEELRLAHDELEKRVAERTEQLKESAEALRRSEERYALAVQGANDAIWDMNLATGDVYHSLRYRSMLGYENNEVADNVSFTECMERIHPDDHQRVMEARDAYLKGRIPVYEVEYRLRHKDGSYLWVASRGACLRDSQGKPYRMAGSLTDITQRKKLEQQLLQAQKMESIGLLAGGVAHEFNNLLTAISGYGQILQESISPDDELSRDSIAQVLKAAARAAELTRGLLAFSRKQVISPKPVHIDALISNTSRLFQRIIGEDIELTTDFSGKNLLIKADPGQVEQVLMNLATNARDAMPNGGRLTITTRQVIIKGGSEAQYDLSGPGKYALISVADTGTGIDKKLLENIFEPFYTTKEVGMGTGLGLSIVHGIVKQHNGSILVSSELGSGTTFNIYLPLIEGYAVTEKSKTAAPFAAGMETLLIAEDEEIVRVFMKKILERAGYKVIIADNGEDAVARFKENDDISLVLSDVVMPGKNGREMLNEMKKTKPGIKVVFISGYTADIISQKGMIEEGTEFITKPFNKSDLLRIVREVLDKG
jgi:two-component system cell cycle sensor histidine kinase/response regulator CckA